MEKHINKGTICERRKIMIANAIILAAKANQARKTIQGSGNQIKNRLQKYDQAKAKQTQQQKAVAQKRANAAFQKEANQQRVYDQMAKQKVVQQKKMAKPASPASKPKPIAAPKPAKPTIKQPKKR